MKILKVISFSTCQNLNFSFFFCLFFLPLGCLSSDENGNPNAAQLKEKETIAFPIDSLTSSTPSAVGYFTEKGQEFIHLYNRPSHTILYFNLQKKVFAYQTKLAENGPNTVHHPVDFQRISADSMLVMAAYTKRMYLINKKGEVMKNYDFTKHLPPGTLWKSEPLFFFDLYKTNCLIHTFVLGDQRQPSEFYSVPVGAVFDYVTEKIKPNLFSYPPVYQKGNAWGIYQAVYRQTLDEKGQIILSFPMDKKIYVKSLTGAAMGKYNAACDVFIDDPMPLKKGGNDEEYNLLTDAYEDVVYDRYRKVYYRFATKGVAEFPKKRVLSGAVYKPAYVVILNERFKKIGETRLPQTRHNIQSFFVGRKGLYISDSHPDNPNNREDRLTFTCYELVPAP